MERKVPTRHESNGIVIKRGLSAKYIYEICSVGVAACNTFKTCYDGKRACLFVTSQPVLRNLNVVFRS